MISCVDLASSMETVTFSPGFLGNSMLVTVPLCTPPTCTSAPSARPATLSNCAFSWYVERKQIFLAPNDEDPRSENCQRHNDECSQPCYSRHISPYDCFKNSLTNPMLLC